jgi:predicted amidohydrolase YtcJ
MYPLRTWIDAGLYPIHSSDAPVIPDPRPLPALATAVTRRDEAGKVWGQEQAITIAEAVSMMTTWAARADGEEAVRGQIAPGFLADFTVLETDPELVSPADLAEIPVAATIVGGKVRWSAGDL